MEPVKPSRNWGGTAPETVDNRRPQCRGSNVQPHHEIYINGHDHAGLVTHVCCREEHEDTDCVCKCGRDFCKNFKGVRP